MGHILQFGDISDFREGIGVLSLRSGSALLVGPLTEFGAVAPGDVEAVALLAGVVCRGGFPIGKAVAFWLVASLGMVLAFWAACGWGFLLGGGGEGVLLPLSSLCFLLPCGAFLGLCWVIQKQTIPSLNDLLVVFQSPSSVKHCKVGTMRGGRGSCLQKPLGIMGWASGATH